jgi:DNA repair photolyase
MVAPVIPAVNDSEIEAILKTVRTAGATEAGYVMLRLPHEVKEVFKDWLQATMPERAAKVMSLVKSASGGKEYESAFGTRQRGTGPYAWTIGRRFELACQRLGLNRSKLKLTAEHFRRPPQPGEQLTLL